MREAVAIRLEQDSPQARYALDTLFLLLGESWREARPDEQAALQAEIDRLAKENAALREQLATAGASPPEKPGEGARPEKVPVLPREDEMDRAFGLMEKFLRRFMSIFREETGKAI